MVTAAVKAPSQLGVLTGPAMFSGASSAAGRVVSCERVIPFSQRTKLAPGCLRKTETIDKTTRNSTLRH